MKNYYIMALAMAAALTSCSKDGDNARILRIAALHYGDRNTVGQTTLQDGRTITRTIRQGS